MQSIELVKAKIHAIDQLIEYAPNSVVINTMLKKPTGNIRLIAIDAGQVQVEKTSPFDIFIQIIDGNAELTIDDENYILKRGEVILIPAHASHLLKANERFKIMSVIIKSGYEEVSLAEDLW